MSVFYYYYYEQHLASLRTTSDNDQHLTATFDNILLNWSFRKRTFVLSSIARDSANLSFPSWISSSSSFSPSKI